MLPALDVNEPGTIDALLKVANDYILRDEHVYQREVQRQQEALLSQYTLEFEAYLDSKRVTVPAYQPPADPYSITNVASPYYYYPSCSNNNSSGVESNRCNTVARAEYGNVRSPPEYPQPMAVTTARPRVMPFADAVGKAPQTSPIRNAAKTPAQPFPAAKYAPEPSPATSPDPQDGAKTAYLTVGRVNTPMGRETDGGSAPPVPATDASVSQPTRATASHQSSASSPQPLIGLLASGTSLNLRHSVSVPLTDSVAAAAAVPSPQLPHHEDFGPFFQSTTEYSSALSDGTGAPQLLVGSLALPTLETRSAASDTLLSSQVTKRTSGGNALVPPAAAAALPPPPSAPSSRAPDDHGAAEVKGETASSVIRSDGAGNTMELTAFELPHVLAVGRRGTVAGPPQPVTAETVTEEAEKGTVAETARETASEGRPRPKTPDPGVLSLMSGAVPTPTAVEGSPTPTATLSKQKPGDTDGKEGIIPHPSKVTLAQSERSVNREDDEGAEQRNRDGDVVSVRAGGSVRPLESMAGIHQMGPLTTAATEVTSSQSPTAAAAAAAADVVRDVTARYQRLTHPTEPPTSVERTTQTSEHGGLLPTPPTHGSGSAGRTSSDFASAFRRHSPLQQPEHPPHTPTATTIFSTRTSDPAANPLDATDVSASGIGGAPPSPPERRSVTAVHTSLSSSLRMMPLLHSQPHSLPPPQQPQPFYGGELAPLHPYPPSHTLPNPSTRFGAMGNTVPQGSATPNPEQLLCRAEPTTNLPASALSSAASAPRHQAAMAIPSSALPSPTGTAGNSPVTINVPPTSTTIPRVTLSPNAATANNAAAAATTTTMAVNHLLSHLRPLADAAQRAKAATGEGGSSTTTTAADASAAEDVLENEVLPHGVQCSVIDGKTFVYIPPTLPTELQAELRQHYTALASSRKQERRQANGSTSTGPQPHDSVTRAPTVAGGSMVTPHTRLSAFASANVNAPSVVAPYLPPQQPYPPQAQATPRTPSRHPTREQVHSAIEAMLHGGADTSGKDPSSVGLITGSEANSRDDTGTDTWLRSRARQLTFDERDSPLHEPPAPVRRPQSAGGAVGQRHPTLPPRAPQNAPSTAGTPSFSPLPDRPGPAASFLSRYTFPRAPVPTVQLQQQQPPAFITVPQGAASAAAKQAAIIERFRQLTAQHRGV